MMPIIIIFIALICHTESSGRQVELTDNNLRLITKRNSLEVSINAFGAEFRLHLTIQESPVKLSRKSKLVFYSGKAKVANGRRHQSGKADLVFNKSKSLCNISCIQCNIHIKCILTFLLRLQYLKL